MAASPKFGIAFVGDIPWGRHLCQFYETKDDLVEILVPYFAEGLKNNEACMWVTSEPLEAAEATAALAKVVPHVHQFIDSGQLLIFPYQEWYLKDGTFDAERVLHGWIEKEEEALSRGFEGLRLSGNAMWVERSLWDTFIDYEEAINNVVGSHRMIVVCTYSLAECRGGDVVDVIRNHAGTIIKHGGKWTVVEDIVRRKDAETALQAAHEEVQALNEELQCTNENLHAANETLEQRVQERTEALTRELSVYAAVVRLSEPLLFPAPDAEALTLAILEEAKEITGSAHGFVALIDPHTKDVVAYGHTKMMLDECAIPHAQRRVRFPIGPNGRYHELWGQPLNEKEGFFTNAPAEHPASTGAPEGHVTLEQFLAVPALLGGEAVGEIALANPGRDYTQHDLETVERLAKVYALAVMRMQAEERLHVTSLYARNLIEASLDPLVTISAEGTITDVNRATEEVTGYLRHELIGSDFSDYFTEPGEARKGYEQVFANGFVKDYPLRIRHKSGILTDVLYNATVYRNEVGEVQGVFAAARDITDRKRAEEELQRYSGHLEAIVEERTAQLKDAERLAGIGETAAMIGHDLRNPLQGLQYIVDLQKLRFERIHVDRRSTDEWEKEQELFGRISEQVFYMDKIVGDLQDYTRPVTPEHKVMKVGFLLNDVLQSLPHNDNVKIVTDISDFTFNADFHLMHRVFANLILNAMQAMPDGGTLTISATSDDGSVAIRVHDTGTGIPHEMRDKLFSPLTTGKSKGTGLGLAVVKRIVEAHEGTVEFESEEGNGTTFTVTLPQTSSH